jgi:hypothetical protein
LIDLRVSLLDGAGAVVAVEQQVVRRASAREVNPSTTTASSRAWRLGK